VQIEFRTNSDWSSVTVNGIARTLMSQYAILEGSGASGLSFQAGSPSFIAASKSDSSTVKIQVKAIIMNPADQLVLTISKGSSGVTDVLLYKWVAGQFQYFGTYTNSSHQTTQFVINSRDLCQTFPVDLDSLPTDISKRAWAIYYPWYGSPYGPSGGWSHWSAVSEGNIGTSAHFPILGAYDSRDEQMVEGQILWARYAGLDGFIASWDGPSDAWTDKTFSVLIKVAEKLSFKVGVYYEAYRSPPLDQASMANELIYFVQKYSNSPALLKINGRPVIFIYRAEENEPEFWAEVRTLVEASVGKVFLVGNLNDPKYVSVFDGFHMYLGLDAGAMRNVYRMYTEQMGFATDTTDLATALTEMQNTGHLIVHEKLTCGTASPGYDDSKTRSPATIVDRTSGELYRAAWNAIKESDVKCALVGTWNEWHEGTEIEPSVEYGFQYLAETRTQVSQFKNISLPGVTGTPNIQYTLTMSDTPSLLEITVQNKGDGNAYAVRVETDMGGLNTNVLSSSPYPHKAADIVNYIPLLRPGESSKVSITFNGVTKASLVINSLTIRCFSTDGSITVTTLNNVRFN
jgi:hypothetical protein